MKKLIKYPFQKLYKFFLWSSGAELEILEQAPHDKNKFFGIGGTIIFTALMASFAGGYAFFTAFKEVIEVATIIDSYGEEVQVEIYSKLSYVISVFFGFFWGSLIFNLDRYIVSTFGVGDGRKTISKQELFEAAPRLVMAILLGFVIAIPLELKIFEKSINVEIQEMIDEDLSAYNQNNPFAYKITERKNEISELKNQILEKENDLKSIDVPNFQKSRISELEEKMGETNNKVKANYSHLRYSKEMKNKAIQNNDENEIEKWRKTISYYQGLVDKGNTNYWSLNKELNKLKDENNKDFEATKDRIRTDLEILREDLTFLKSDLTVLLEDEKRMLDNKKNVVKGYGGLLGRLTALERISYKTVVTNEGSEIKVKTPVWYAKWLLTILFMFIEIAPILFKMMTERGTYDDILDRIKHEAKVRQLLLQSNINEEINTAVKVHADKNSQKLTAELSANKGLLESIAKAQAEIAQVAIEEWKKEQLEKVKNNPSSMIKS